MSNRYTEISLPQMEAALTVKHGLPFQSVDEQGSSEVVFERPFSHTESLVLRVYSSIFRGVSRDCGSDAIRCVLFDKRLNKPVGRAGRTNRVKGWETRLREKLNELARMVDTLDKCPKCGYYLVLRESQHGKFWGCSNYPTCKTTKPYVE